MEVFITGASGYIGGSVACAALRQGHKVRGLTRSISSAKQLAACGIAPVIGGLDNSALLAAEASKADIVINAANADHREAAEALISGLRGTGKTLIHTSGASIVGDDARGEFCSESIYSEDTPLLVHTRKKARRDIDLFVLGATELDIRTSVIVPSLVYGEGSGLKKHSIQVPFLARNALEVGAVQIVGKGLNTWSNVHIEDLVDLYILVAQKAPAGSLYFAESAECSFCNLATALAKRLNLPQIENLDAGVATERWGAARALFTFGSNCRVRASRARNELGWTPVHQSLEKWILSETDLF